MTLTKSQLARERRELLELEKKFFMDATVVPKKYTDALETLQEEERKANLEIKAARRRIYDIGRIRTAVFEKIRQRESKGAKK